MTTKQLKPRAQAPEAVLAVVAETAPRQPPAVIEQDRATTLNLRVRESTIVALAAVARERRQTLKQVITHALQAAGVPIVPVDLEDRTPRRRV